MTDKPYELPAHQLIAEPELKFHPERSEDVSPHPLEGLRRFGPYSRAMLGAVSDPIRLALIGPPEAVGKVRSLLAELEQRYVPRERTAYLIEFDKFSATFGVRALLADRVVATLPADLDSELARSAQPHRVLADYITRAVGSLRSRRTEFDVLLLYLPDRWEAAFAGGPNDDFNLHDYVKGVTASASVPAQIIRESGAMDYRCRCSVMWRLGIALYCKAGGIPWKLAYAEPETAYVGLGYAIRRNAGDGSKFVTCCSQVFDHEGTGLEFIAYETGDVEIEGDNPFLSRSDMHRIMARSLALYQELHGGRSPKTLVVHKLNPYKDDEIDGCFDACRAIERIELIQIQRDAYWRGVHLDPPRVPDKEKSKPGYAVRRGSYLMLGGAEALLWTQGNVPQGGGKDFFKEMKGTPAPLIVRRAAGHGPFFEICNAILGLTKMDWNNDALYDRLPVTLGYAKVLAQTLKRIGSLSSRPYPFRLFM